MSNQLFEEVESVEELTDDFTPEEIAYYLAYIEPEVGSKLLEELLYYRAQGRI